MSFNPSSSMRDPIVAAGGVVLGAGTNSGKICLVRRRRYPGEIALPKGKLRKGEDAIDAAQREVSEETGCKVKVQGYAGTTRYLVGSFPKTVFYFEMETDGNEHGGPKDKEEIEGVEWLTPRDALLALTHREDRDLVSALFGITKGEQP